MKPNRAKPLITDTTRRGAWIETYRFERPENLINVAPAGVRGLKHLEVLHPVSDIIAPRRVRIETPYLVLPLTHLVVARRGAD